MKASLAFLAEISRTRQGIWLTFLSVLTSVQSISVILLQPVLVSAFVRTLTNRQEIVTLLVATLVATPVALYASASANNALLQHVRKASKEILFDSIIRKPLTFFHDHNEGWVESSLSTGSHAAQTLVHESIAIFSRLLFLAGAAVLFAIWMSPFSGTIFLVVLLAYLWLSLFLFKRNAERVQQAVQSTAAVSAQIADAIANVTAIQHNNTFDHERRRLDRFLRLEKSTYRASQASVDRADATQRLILAGVLGAFLMISHSARTAGDGTFLALFVLTMLTYGQLESTGRALNSFFEHYHHLASVLTSIGYRRRGDTRRRGAGSVPASTSRKRATPPLIQAEKVSFGYRPREQILDRVELEIRPGSHQLIHGSSGAGKTTFLKLLTGQLTPTGGRVLVADRNVQDLSTREKAETFCIVSQGAPLFDRPLHENVAYGHANQNRAVILQLLRELGLRPPPGQDEEEWLDTPLGRNGCRLSGGERQRVLIARAILAARPVLVLDEATSELDPETEKRVLEIIHDRLAGCSIVAVSHHPHARVSGYASLSLSRARAAARAAQRAAPGSAQESPST